MRSGMWMRWWILGFGVLTRAERALPRPIWLVVVLGIALTPTIVRSQRLSGRVQRAGDNAGIPGVLVLATPASGSRTARALSGADGSFVLLLPGRGSYDIQARRIGFRPIQLSSIPVQADTAITLTLDEVPLPLPPVTAKDRNECRVAPALALPAGVLWNEARTAMLVAEMTLEARDMHFLMVLHSRLVDTRPPRVLLESPFEFREDSGFAPWISLEPDTLLRRGYAIVDTTGVRLAAPDLRVLLSDYFDRHHCFRIAETPADRVGQIGLSFTPVSPGRRTEVTGQLWFDASSRELRQLTFQYVNLPYRGATGSAGGRIDFRRLDNGAWILPDWTITSPIPDRAVLRSGMRSPMSAVNVEGRVSTESRSSFLTRETGGTLLRVRDATDTLRTLWERRRQALVLQFRARESVGGPTRPVGGMTVAFRGSAVQRVTDSTGTARFDRMIPGQYVVEHWSALQDALGQAPHRSVFTLPEADSLRTEELIVESDRQMVLRLCKHDSTRAVVFGSLSHDDAPVAHQELRVRMATSLDARADSVAPITLRTDDRGRYAVCNVPRGVELIFIVPLSTGSTVTRRSRVPLTDYAHPLDVFLPSTP